MPVFNATIDAAAGRLRIPKEAMALLGWQGESGKPVTFELMERGRARLHLGDQLAAAITAAGAKGDTAAQEALPILLHVCTWESTNRTNPVPREARFHMLETGTITGSLHVAVAKSWIEVWSEEFRLRRIGFARDLAQDYLLPSDAH